jgi:hypothetical protein
LKEVETLKEVVSGDRASTKAIIKSLSQSLRFGLLLVTSHGNRMTGVKATN